MRPELREEMLRILEELSKGEPIGMTFGDSSLTIEAIPLLVEHGAVSNSANGAYKITTLGYEYYKQLKSPLPYWLKENWLRLCGLIVAIAGVVAGILIAVL